MVINNLLLYFQHKMDFGIAQSTKNITFEDDDPNTLYIMKISLPRPTRFLAYYKEYSKIQYLLKPRNYYTYLLLGHACIVCPCGSLI